jgi:hypothetical protein
LQIFPPQCSHSVLRIQESVALHKPHRDFFHIWTPLRPSLGNRCFSSNAGCEHLGLQRPRATGESLL